MFEASSWGSAVNPRTVASGVGRWASAPGWRPELVAFHCCRFVVYSYKYVHEDGRVSYPLCFIFSSPVGETQLYLSREKGLRFAV